MRTLKSLSTTLALVTLLAGCGGEEPAKNPVVLIPTSSRLTVLCSSVPTCKLACDQDYVCKLDSSSPETLTYYNQCINSRKACYSTKVAQ